MPRISQKDIAEASGVSASLVSRILRGNMGNVSATPQVRAKVLETAVRLGYSPDRRARGLRTGKNDTIAVIVPIAKNFSTSIYPELLRGLMEGSKDCEYDFIYRYFSSREEEIRALRYAADMHIDGLIYAPSAYEPLKEETQALFTKLRENNVQIMFCMERYDIDGAYFVCVDDIEGARMAARYLIEAGAHEIVYLYGLMERRLQAFQDVCMDAGVHLHVVRCPGFSMEDGRRAATQLCQEGDAPFVAATCDVMAVGALQVFREWGRKPCLIGFDGLELRSLLENPFATIRQPVYKVGKLAVKNLLSRLHGNEISQVFVAPELLRGF